MKLDSGDTAQLLKDIYQEIKHLSHIGEQASYIPELKNVNPDQYAIALHFLDGEEYSYGDSQVKFSIQSITKIFSLAMIFSISSEKLWERLNYEPSGMPFNSVIQLEMEKGIPRNPLINSGAIVMADMLISSVPDIEKRYLEFIRELAKDQGINYNKAVAQSEFETGYLNAATINILKYYGNIHNDIERVLKFYFLQCSVEMSCTDLARAAMHFTDRSKPFSVNAVELTNSQKKRMTSIMQTCGFYDGAGEFAYLVGLPAKSGVGGGILALCPGKHAVAVWSPRLNDKGNSVMGIKSLELLTTKMEISVF